MQGDIVMILLPPVYVIQENKKNIKWKKEKKQSAANLIMKEEKLFCKIIKNKKLLFRIQTALLTKEQKI